MLTFELRRFSNLIPNHTAYYPFRNKKTHITLKVRIPSCTLSALRCILPDVRVGKKRRDCVLKYVIHSSGGQSGFWFGIIILNLAGHQPSKSFTYSLVCSLSLSRSQRSLLIKISRWNSLFRQEDSKNPSSQVDRNSCESYAISNSYFVSMIKKTLTK